MTAIRQSGFATLARVAVQKTMLPFAAYLGRLILSFHISSVSSPRKHVSKWRLVGKRSVSGTREHINEVQGVKAVQNSLSAPYWALHLPYF